MSEECQRLRDAARDVERESAELENCHRVTAAADMGSIERRLYEAAVKRGSQGKAMICKVLEESQL